MSNQVYESPSQRYQPSKYKFIYTKSAVDPVIAGGLLPTGLILDIVNGHQAVRVPSNADHLTYNNGQFPDLSYKPLYEAEDMIYPYTSVDELGARGTTKFNVRSSGTYVINLFGNMQASAISATACSLGMLVKFYRADGTEYAYQHGSNIQSVSTTAFAVGAGLCMTRHLTAGEHFEVYAYTYPDNSVLKTLGTFLEISKL